jgi:hypothetical protein
VDFPTTLYEEEEEEGIFQPLIPIPHPQFPPGLPVFLVHAGTDAWVAIVGGVNAPTIRIYVVVNA